ncbi:MAG: pyridoxal-phosphate dependent enzyme [Deltaproteobacteria bacterium]|uniref:Pyridoxal-phosphate dependent enzyme n=1 Tax=Candidatus Zymogenus saltonus TaxID=2844893 RepID=A0A9D8KES7_9DELT|nr:pyridoxal-phosphate dependent enzyme [Candidatus Zymogenus saltonus]
MVTIKDVREAAGRIDPHINRTPVVTSRTVNEKLGASLYFKCESFQRAGSFKIRGAFSAISLLNEEEKTRGVVAHSSGNHAQAVALATRLLGVKSTVVMPKGSPDVKVAATRGYGAEIVFSENSEGARIAETERLIEEHGYTLVHPYDNDNVIAGAGTAALELLEEVKGIEVLIAPVGGGGLLSGTSISAKGIDENIEVYAAEPARADDAFRSIVAGHIVKNERPPDTIADGLRTSLCERTFEIIRENVSGIVTVSEMEIVEAMRFLWERMKLVVEPSGAVSAAALLSGKIDVMDRMVGVIISGGNVDLERFFSALKV